jgi:hypothetical protein
MNLEKLAGDLVSITGTLGSITAQLTGIVAVLAGQPTVSAGDTAAAVRETTRQGRKRADKGSGKGSKGKADKGKAAEAPKAEAAAVDLPEGALCATISTGADNGRTRLPNGLFDETPDIFLTGPNGARFAVSATKDGRAKIGAKFAGQLGLAPGQVVTFERTGKGAFAVKVAGSGPAPKASGGKGKGKKADKAPAADAFDSLDLDAAAVDALDLDGPAEETAAPKAEKPNCAACGHIAVKKAGQTCGRCKRAAAEPKEAPKAEEKAPAAQTAAPKADKGKGKKDAGKGKGSRPAALKGASPAKRDAVKQAAALTGKSLTEVAEKMQESWQEATLRHPTPETSRVGK